MEKGNIFSKDYAEFLESTLRDLIEVPVEGICILTKLEGGGIGFSSHNISLTDKILFAGHLQQDAMLEMLMRNKFIRDPREDSEE